MFEFVEGYWNYVFGEIMRVSRPTWRWNWNFN